MFGLFLKYKPSQAALQDLTWPHHVLCEVKKKRLKLSKLDVTKEKRVPYSDI